MPSSSNNPELALVVDVGVTTINIFLFDATLNLVARQQATIQVAQPLPGWVEQNPVEIYEQVVRLIEIIAVGHEGRISTIGLTGQRGSVVVWNPLTAEPLYPLISWQDTRTAEFCRDLKHTPRHAKLIREHTGLFVDTRASASKVWWLLNSINMLGSQWGTITTWLLYRLTAQEIYLTDRTNAARTMLFNIRDLAWDEDLCRLFGIPMDGLPDVRPSFSDFGKLDSQVLGYPVPINAVVGDQEACLYAAGTKAGTCKITYGATVSALEVLKTFELRDSFMTTLAVGEDTGLHYALEGEIPDITRRIPLAQEKQRYEAVLTQLALETSALLQGMLDRQEVIMIDGDLSQSEFLVRKQETFLDQARLVRQRYPEGAALGVAKLLFTHLVK